MNKKVFIVGAKRTPIGSFSGALASISAQEMGSIVIKSALEQATVAAETIDEVIVGHVLSAGQGQGVGRQTAIRAGIPVDVPAYSLNMVCGSGMKSIINGINSIKSGDSDIVVSAGIENMSSAPYVLNGNVRDGLKMGDQTLIDSMIHDGLTDAFNDYHMGVTAENIAEKHHISREKQDEFSVRSQQRAMAAIENNKFKREIVPIEIATRKGTLVVDTDEYPRLGTSIESLSKLRPAFKKDGTVTAGNASGINDGAVALILASEDAVMRYRLTPMVEVLATGQGGVDPRVMGLGPVPAIKKALERADMKLLDIELLELNEAFASQAIGVMTELATNHGIDYAWFNDKTNVNGGAIALGHPVGASGGRITTTLIYEMLRSNKNIGLASLCIGGGMGTAIILKKV